MQHVKLGCAVLGGVPVLVGAYFCHWVLVAATAVATVSAIVATSTAQSVGDVPLVAGAVDATSGVLLALACCVYLGAHNSRVGIVRLLWLVTIVTASCGYVYTQQTLALSSLPNDVTLVVVTGSAALLALAAIFSRACRPSSRSPRVVYIEFVFVVGALSLRFNSDIHEAVGVNIGWSGWYIACWTASLATAGILQLERSERCARNGTSRSDNHAAVDVEE